MVFSLSNEGQFGNIVRNGKSIVLFSAEWCGPCKIMLPRINNALKNYPDINPIKVDIDSSPKLVEIYNLKKIPTIMLFISGVEKKRREGLMSESDILRMIQE